MLGCLVPDDQLLPGKQGGESPFEGGGHNGAGLGGVPQVPLLEGLNLMR